VIYPISLSFLHVLLFHFLTALFYSVKINHIFIFMWNGSIHWFISLFNNWFPIFFLLLLWWIFLFFFQKFRFATSYILFLVTSNYLRWTSYIDKKIEKIWPKELIITLFIIWRELDCFFVFSFKMSLLHHLISVLYILCRWQFIKAFNVSDPINIWPDEIH
jgi:hypothetical protein